MNHRNLARLFIFKFGVCLISAIAISSSAQAKKLRGDGFPFAEHKSVWRISCNIWRAIPLTIGAKVR
jgi:hypothetical protein